MNSLAHIELNVSNLKKSASFYGLILSKLKWKKSAESKTYIGFKAKDNTHLFLVQAEKIRRSGEFHRKNVGVNHLALRIKSKKEVDGLAVFLEKNNIPLLYKERSRDFSSEYGMKQYYAIFLEDPDRIKIEMVFCK